MDGATLPKCRSMQVASANKCRSAKQAKWWTLGPSICEPFPAANAGCSKCAPKEVQPKCAKCKDCNRPHETTLAAHPKGRQLDTSGPTNSAHKLSYRAQTEPGLA